MSKKSSEVTVTNLLENAHDDSVNSDFEIARLNVHEIIEKATKAVEDFTEIALASQAPRDYEVLNQMFKTLVDANKTLLELQKRRQEIKKDQPNQSQKNVNNTQNIFVGSTAQLQELIRKSKVIENDE